MRDWCRITGSVLAFATMAIGGFAQTDESGTLSTAEFIDAKIEQSWKDNEIEPSEAATDEEWIRRVYLDIAGHIPSLNEVKEFRDDTSPRKRNALIEKLLDSPDYVRNFSTIWTNECIGRGTPRRVSRNGMTKFFREAFAKNRPWNDVVFDIVTAEGHFEENGAVNYILAQMQMRDDAVQLTAKTARLFLGMQVQCTQCHNHPFNDWQQSQFWEFNSFFRQTEKMDHRRVDPDTGRRVDDYSEVLSFDQAMARLERGGRGAEGAIGPVYFEKRSGLMQVALPTFMGTEVDAGAYTDRRKEFGKLLMKADQGHTPMIAKAMVNRMWGHFFGYAFTRPVDDIGPHNPPSHPALMERLAADFVAADYDLKQLIRWIVNSRAYSLTSQFGEDNQIDNPAAGELPLFSHLYVKSMEAEQLYDSLIVATNAHQSGGAGWEAQEAQRRRWMQQFVVAFDTDENDEATTFNGTIPQALMMMNSELIDKAVSAEPGSFLYQLLGSSGSDTEKIQDLYVAALSRRASRGEISKAQKLIRAYPPNARLAAFQDLFWALLNSNEFIFVH